MKMVCARILFVATTVGAKIIQAADFEVPANGNPTSADLLCDDTANEGTVQCQEWALAGEWYVCRLQNFPLTSSENVIYFQLTQYCHYISYPFCIKTSATTTNCTWKRIVGKAVEFVILEMVINHLIVSILPTREKRNAESGRGMENGERCLSQYGTVHLI